GAAALRAVRHRAAAARQEAVSAGHQAAPAAERLYISRHTRWPATSPGARARRGAAGSLGAAVLAARIRGTAGPLGISLPPAERLAFRAAPALLRDDRRHSLGRGAAISTSGSARPNALQRRASRLLGKLRPHPPAHLPGGDGARLAGRSAADANGSARSPGQRSQVLRRLAGRWP